MVFLLPGQTLPEGSAAGVYIRIPPAILQRRNERRKRQLQRPALQNDDGVVLDGGDDVMESSAAMAAAAAAAASSQEPHEEPFTFLGALANDKQSAIFRVRLHDSVDEAGAGVIGASDEDAMIDESTATMSSLGLAGAAGANNQEDMMITLGISLEPIANITAQLAALRASTSASASKQAPEISSILSPSTTSSSALVPITHTLSNPPRSIPNPQIQLQLARKIITNAFNFLASFAAPIDPPPPPPPQSPQHQQQQQQEEMVPLRAFRDWWSKFEKKLLLDPGFLDREDG